MASTVAGPCAEGTQAAAVAAAVCAGVRAAPLPVRAGAAAPLVVLPRLLPLLALEAGGARGLAAARDAVILGGAGGVEEWADAPMTGPSSRGSSSLRTAASPAVSAMPACMDVRVLDIPACIEVLEPLVRLVPLERGGGIGTEAGTDPEGS